MSYRKTILHVDDDPQLTRLVAQHLGPLGYDVTSESAGINRQGVANERVVRGRLSEPPRPQAMRR